MGALRDVLEERHKVEAWRSYMAEMAWAAARSQYKEFPFPSWLELTQKKTVQDSRTAEQIRDDLAARLTAYAKTEVKYDAI